MHLTEVNSKQTEKDFLMTPLSVYKNDPHWIRPLDNDIKAIFDPGKNKLFKHGEAIRWVLKNDKDVPIGRVAAFINENTSRTSEYVTGGMGFFECINDQKAADCLFDACKEWLIIRGMEAMDGPINFGERNEWWGLLIEGFMPPTYHMNYNPPYYIELFQSYGFQIYFNQLVFNYEVNKEVPDIFKAKAERIFKSTAFKFEHIKKDSLEKYAIDLTDIYNQAWSKMPHHKPVTIDQTLKTLKQMKPVMDERLIWFGYFKDKPIAFFVMLPEINQVIKYLNGRMDGWGKIKFLYYKSLGVIDKMFGVLFGVVPEFQGKGIDGAVIMAAGRVIQPMKRYKNLEMNWIGDFNPKMIKLVENLGTKVVKRYSTFRKIFDHAKPFSRAPILD
ncbi:MAG: hypothetical protein H0W62_12920 [Chitinophagales bacterium]|nr:hypothetical protein [Chitinophagales bacterium]